MDKFVIGTLPEKRQVKTDANIKKRKTRKYTVIILILALLS